MDTNKIIYYVILLAIWLLWWYRRGRPQIEQRRRRAEYLRLASELQSAVAGAYAPADAVPFLERIRTQTAANPDGRLDYDEFPAIPADEEGVSYYAGARDIFGEGVAGTDWMNVVAMVHAVRRGRIRDWRIVEAVVRHVDPIVYIDLVLNELSVDDVAKRVRPLFLEIARRSADYAAVKWGIIISSINTDPDNVREIMVLARHSEFTLYTCQALVREMEQFKSCEGLLKGLVKVTEGWGLCQAMNFAARFTDMMKDEAFVRTAIIEGMRNGASAKPQIAALLEETCDLVPWADTARHDLELSRAMLDIAYQLIWEPKPNGMLLQVKNGAALVSSWLRLVEALPASIESLGVLWGIGTRLSDDTLPWPEREELLGRTRQVFIVKLSREIIADAIRDNNGRMIALQIAVEVGMNDAVPVILDDIRRQPDPANVDAFGRLAGDDMLAELVKVLPDADELAWRDTIERSTDDETPLDVPTMVYGIALRHVARLNTSVVIAAIKRAAHDAHPFVRTSAMQGAESLQRWTLDRELKQLVREALADGSPAVRQAAEEAAVRHTLQASIDRPLGPIRMEALGLSVN